MKKFILIFLIITVSGCVSAQIPAYLQDKMPYTRKFYVGYDQALQATTEALEILGWGIEQALDSAVYEEYHVDEEAKDSLLITDLRQTPMGIGTRYAKVNIYIRSKGEVSEIEIRYVTITSLPFKNIETYSNESAANRIFARIEAQVNKQ